jgi:hypothetical protein
LSINLNKKVQNMKKTQWIMVLAFAMVVAAASASTMVINVDVGNGGGTYSGQGAYADPGKNFWNGFDTSGTNLKASDGVTQPGVSVSIGNTGGYTAGLTNKLMKDYRFVTGGNSGTITISGLKANADYLIYVYAYSQTTNKQATVTLNGVTAPQTTGAADPEIFVEGSNYVKIATRSDSAGVIAGTFRRYPSGESDLSGFQIIGELSAKVVSIAGAEGLTVHSPGDTMTVKVDFSEPVTLSQAGGAKLRLNIAGTLVDAVQTGSLTGQTLTFEAIAPAMTTIATKVVANSLQLLNGATLLDSSLAAANLAHGEVPLRNDQISVQRLSVYPAVPGLTPSVRYSFRVHEVGSTQWMTPFAWFTKCIDKGTGDPNNRYYNKQIGGWSNTYCNFEMANHVPVEVEITRLDSSTGLPVDIQKATPHPRRKVRSWRVENGKAYVIFDKPVLFAVDIDGQLDDHNAPKLFDNSWSDSAFPYTNENAIHTVTIFANPFILDKPVLGAPGVYAVEPGVIPPDDGSWTTLYFKPGVHKMFPGDRWDKGDEFHDFRIRSNRSYYIPGDAMVHGTFNNGEDPLDARNIRIFGHGTISGEKILHRSAMIPPLEDSWRQLSFSVSNAAGCKVEGITVTDPAFHTGYLSGGWTTDPALFNYVRWFKTITWRANGDGTSPNGSGYLEDCFLRTADDGTYVKGLGIRRMVYWNDCNGIALRCNHIGFERGYSYPPSLPDKLYVEDIDIIYGRRVFMGSPAVIGLPGNYSSQGGSTGSHVVFRNINYEDPRPTRILFGFDTTACTGDVAGIRFENIRAAATSVFGNTDTFMGDPNSHIRNLIFDNVTLAGQHYDSLDDFTHNAYVYDFVFENTAPQTMTYLNTSGYGKWYMRGDWDSGVEPANNDIVNHTAIAEVLTVDAPAWAGTLNIAHADTAAVSIELGGKLKVANALSVGSAGSGELNLLYGSLELQSSLGSALSVADGNIHIENGTLLWAGNHISDIQAFYAAGKLTLAKGQDAMLSASGTLIGQYGQSKLYADYNNATPGYTTVWVARLTKQVVTLHVEAESYTTMSGIKNETTTDTGGGQNIGYIENGDWTQYTINVPAAGTYQVDFRVASGGSGGTINMVVGGSTVGSAAVANTGGWQTWKTVTTPATFSTAGVQTLWLNFVGGTGYLYNINWFKCTISIPILPGDFSGDSKVNLVDFELLSSDWQNGYEMPDLLDMAQNWLIH